jgi:hypothetical protein
MRVYRTSALMALGLVIVLAALIFVSVPVVAQDPPLEEQLADIVLQIEDELRLVGTPEETIARCSQMVLTSQITGFDRETFIANLVDELSVIVEDEASLEAGLDAVDTLVAEYQALAGEV